jgi:hypothetical protein
MAWVWLALLAGMFLPALLRSFVYRTPVTAYHDAGGGWPGLVAALKVCAPGNHSAIDTSV